MLSILRVFYLMSDLFLKVPLECKRKRNIFNPRKTYLWIVGSFNKKLVKNARENITVLGDYSIELHCFTIF